jgi:cytochrome c556
MKKILFAALFAALTSWTFAGDPKPYDSDAIVTIMHSNGATYGAVNKALGAGDWDAVSAGFKQFAANADTALTYAPPKGDPAQWTAIWTDFKKAATQGQDAAAAKDADKVKAALAALGADRNKGHAAFK